MLERASIAVDQVVTQFVSLHDTLRELDSLEPGKGYDPIGFELCKLVYSKLSLRQKSLVLDTLQSKRKNLIKDFQTASIKSEIALETHYSHLLMSSRQELSAKVNWTDLQRSRTATAQAFHELLQDYPHDWAEQRARDESLLFTKLGSNVGLSTTDTVYYLGQSGLPFSAIELYYLVGSKVVWIDRNYECLTTARNFLNWLTDLGLLPSGAITMVHSQQVDFLSLQSTFTTHGNPAMFVLLNSEGNSHELIEALRLHQVSSLICVDTHGLAEVLYPKVDRRHFEDRYSLRHIILPRHLDILDSTEISTGVSATLSHGQKSYISLLGYTLSSKPSGRLSKREN